MKLVRTTQYQFGWLIIFPLLDVVFLMIFFLLLSSNFVLQPGISVNVPFSKFMLAPQMKYQIVSITSGGTVYFRDQKISIDELGSQLDLARKEGRSIIIKADRYTPYETVIRVANVALEHGVSSVALATTTQRLPEAKSLVLPPIQHRPSYASHQPKLKTLPPLTPDLSIPSSAATGPVRLPRVKANANAPGLARKTTANFADLPATLGDPVFADVKFRLTRPDAPANARFRVAIDEHGAIRFCFLIESSGDPALDEQARNFLQLCRLKTKENSSVTNGSALFWTTATILWGKDRKSTRLNSSHANISYAV